jgi:Zn-finger nucleic acid-binding protein
MFCPSCQNTLRERERDGVMLDVCPGCGGVWLDRGELEKLTRSERSYYRRDDDNDDDDDEDRRDRRDWPRGEQYEARGPQTQTNRRRGGFLDNIFGNFGGDDD